MSDIAAKVADPCSRCGYSLAGLQAERCPECGTNIYPSQPLDSYRQRRGSYRARLLLFPDRVIVRHKWILGDEAEGAAWLARLDPSPYVARRRNKSFQSGIGVFVLGAIIPLFSFLVRSADALPWPALVISGSVSATGLIVALFSFRRIESTQFRSIHPPGFVMLEVLRNGPDVSRYDQFVANVRRQIVMLRKIDVTAST
jgi:hypothetical protein